MTRRSTFFFLGNADLNAFFLPGIAFIISADFGTGKGGSKEKDGETIKNYLFLCTTISREREVVSG